MLARSPGSWKPYLRILTPTPSSIGYKVRFGIGIPSKLVGALVAASGTHGHLWSAWCGLLQTWSPDEFPSSTLRQSR